jgi:XRE family transcriptional regulator, regulator of sulfur utilization
MVDDPVQALAARVGRTVRAQRTARGLSLGALAAEAGLSKAILGRIEQGAGNPSMETLWRLSTALGLPLGALLGEDERPRTRVVRAAGRAEVRSAGGLAGALLHADGRARRVEAYALRLAPGADERRDPHLPGTEELLVCTAGALQAGPLGEEAALGPGDALWFAGDAPHRYAAGPDGAEVVCVLTWAAA